MSHNPSFPPDNDAGGSLIVHIGGPLPALSPAERRVARLVVANPAGTSRPTPTWL